MLIGPLIAGCVAAAFFAGTIFREDPGGSFVIVALAVIILAVIFGSMIDMIHDLQK